MADLKIRMVISVQCRQLSDGPTTSRQCYMLKETNRMYIILKDITASRGGDVVLVGSCSLPGPAVISKSREHQSLDVDS